MPPTVSAPMVHSTTALLRTGAHAKTHCATHGQTNKDIPAQMEQNAQTDNVDRNLHHVTKRHMWILRSHTRKHIDRHAQIHTQTGTHRDRQTQTTIYRQPDRETAKWTFPVVWPLTSRTAFSCVVPFGAAMHNQPENRLRCICSELARTQIAAPTREPSTPSPLKH